MIIRIFSAGKSFTGLGKYLTHDAGAETTERVGWTHTLNCANDHVPSAIHEMYNTYLDAELLKQEAGVRRGGRPLEAPVKHFSLNWHPDETPSQEQMIAAVEGYLGHMGWQEHQAILANHTDKAHAHVHVMLNAVHPETGCKLDDGLEQRRSQAWALEYEREHGRIYCEQRLEPVKEREPAPTRPAWMAMKEAEQAQTRIEVAREAAERAREAAETRPPTQGEEWTILKDEQRQARMDFFEDGRDAFRSVRRAVYHEVRQEFRDEWGAYYAARRDGLDGEALREMRDALVARQDVVLKERRDAACTALRETRDEKYAALLGAQRDERGELTARQAVGVNALAEMRGDAANQNERAEAYTPAAVDMRLAFHDTAQEVTRTAHEPAEPNTDRSTSDECGTHFVGPGSGMRDGTDVVAGLGLGMMGGAATLVERLFDGFLDSGPRLPAPANDSRPAVDPEPPRNPFAAAAQEARRFAEQEEELRRDAWWDERRARARD